MNTIVIYIDDAPIRAQVRMLDPTGGGNTFTRLYIQPDWGATVALAAAFAPLDCREKMR